MRDGLFSHPGNVCRGGLIELITTAGGREFSGQLFSVEAQAIS